MGCGAGPFDYSEDLGNGYYYHSSSSIDRFIAPKSWNSKTPIIPSKVVRYRKQNGYIAAKREVIQLGSSGSRVASGTFDYWILDTTTSTVRGPMDKGDFDIQAEKLGLSANLKLD
jgi:hypothetical protein